MILYRVKHAWVRVSSRPIYYASVIDREEWKRMLANESVAFHSHLGGLYFVSVTSGFLCINEEVLSA